MLIHASAWSESSSLLSFMEGHIEWSALMNQSWNGRWSGGEITVADAGLPAVASFLPMASPQPPPICIALDITISLLAGRVYGGSSYLVGLCLDFLCGGFVLRCCCRKERISLPMHTCETVLNATTAIILHDRALRRSWRSASGPIPLFGAWCSISVH